jgi:hypothetical protein
MGSGSFLAYTGFAKRHPVLYAAVRVRGLKTKNFCFGPGGLERCGEWILKIPPEGRTTNQKFR